MRGRLSDYGIALLFAPQLLGQALPNSIQRPTDEENQQSRAMNSITKYCMTVDDYSVSHQPRLFAKTRESKETGEWKEFSSKAEWERAGKPTPVAFAWYEKSGNPALFSRLTTMMMAVIATPTTAIGPTEIWRRYDQQWKFPPFATTLTFAASSRFRESGSFYPMDEPST